MFKKVFFVGAFNSGGLLKSEGSFAGAKVQLEIIQCLRNLYPEVDAFAMQEVQTWPFNKLLIRNSEFNNVIFPTLINLKFFKSFVYALQVLVFALRNKPEVVFQYNSSFSLNLLSYVLNMLGVKTVLVLQDINCKPNILWLSFLRPVKIFEIFGLKLAKVAFDIIVPVSDAIISEFSFENCNTIVWPGGVIDEVNPSLVSLDKPSDLTGCFAAVAGTLNEYNGVYLLARTWCDQNIPFVLHIFGDGVDGPKIKELSKQHSNIEYHGRTAPELVKKYLQMSTFNFCLRYSIGIDQRFFFPSKFFDIFAHPGAVLVNDFYGIPEKAKGEIYILNEDLSNLSHLVSEIINECDRSNYINRVKLANNYFSWLTLFKEIHRKLNYDSCS